jgi:mono/diheme cytochrome c family protein
MRIKSLVFGILSLGILSLLLAVCTSGESQSDNAADKIKRGEYLVTVAGCHDCHSPKIMTEMGPVPDPDRHLIGHPADQKVPEFPAGVLGPDKWGAVGDNNFTAWAGPWGISFAANLTPDEVTGIGSWDEESFISGMRSGKHMGAGRAILPPMPWFNLAEATDEDLGAIFAYLKSLKPYENMVPAPIPPAEQ